MSAIPLRNSTALDSLSFSELRSLLADSWADSELLSDRHNRRDDFSPSLSYGRHFGPPAPTARQAAVLVMLERRQGNWSIPLTVRPEHLPDHPGQVSLPGGRLEAGESHQQAAEREFVEELGCSTFPGKVIGELLPLYVYHSDYFVRPFVAICELELEYAPCPREVECVLHLPVSLLLEGIFTEREYGRGRATWTATTIDCHGTPVWGATAMMLAELLVLLG